MSASSSSGAPKGKAASGARGASKPASDATELGSNDGQIIIGSFNYGIQQSMLEGRNKDIVVERFVSVCTKMVGFADLDVLLGCEVGGSGEGFRLNIKAFDKKT